VNLLTENRTEDAVEHLDSTVSRLARTSCTAFSPSLIHNCGLLGSPRSAMWCGVRMLRMGLKPNIVTFNSLIDACAKTRSISLAMEVWSIMTESDVSPNLITYNTMINAFAQACDSQSAETWMEKMLADKIEPDIFTFNAMVSICAKRGDCDGAERWFKRMEAGGTKADPVVFNSVIHACAKAGRPEKAEQWAAALTQATLTFPHQKTYRSLIHASIKGGAIERAEHWLHTMLSQGIRANKTTFDSVIQACAMGGRLDRAAYWQDRMAGFNQTRAEPPHSAQCVRAGPGPSRCSSVAGDDAPGSGAVPYRAAFNRGLEASVRLGDLDSAEGWTQELLASGGIPDRNTVYLLEQVSIQASNRGFPMAQMGQNEHLAWAYGVIISATVRIGDYSSARDWLGAAEDAGLRQRMPLLHSILEPGNNMRRAPRPSGQASAPQQNVDRHATMQRSGYSDILPPAHAAFHQRAQTACHQPTQKYMAEHQEATNSSGADIIDVKALDDLTKAFDLIDAHPFGFTVSL
jgi:leucine-rich PPR motif-containing protein